MLYSSKESRAGLTPDQFEAHIAQSWRAIGGTIADFLRRAFLAAHVAPGATIAHDRK